MKSLRLVGIVALNGLRTYCYFCKIYKCRIDNTISPDSGAEKNKEQIQWGLNICHFYTILDSIKMYTILKYLRS